MGESKSPAGTVLHFMGRQEESMAGEGLTEQQAKGELLRVPQAGLIFQRKLGYKQRGFVNSFTNIYVRNKPKYLAGQNFYFSRRSNLHERRCVMFLMSLEKVANLLSAGSVVRNLGFRPSFSNGGQPSTPSSNASPLRTEVSWFNCKGKYISLESVREPGPRGRGLRASSW